MNLKKWEVAPLDRERAAQIAERYSLPFFLAMLLEIRGFAEEGEIRDLLSGGQLSDPFLMKDMDKAVERIHRAIEGFERIAVYGDYDADGVTATSILFTYLEAVGADVMYYIPQREGEGYGMNLHAVETLHQEGVTLIITVDNGISAVEEAACAKETWGSPTTTAPSSASPRPAPWWTPTSRTTTAPIRTSPARAWP